jgi:hypothetical protein
MWLRESNGEGSFMEDKESQREREAIEAVVGRTHVSAMDKIKRLRYLHYMLVPEKLHHPFIEILFYLNPNLDRRFVLSCGDDPLDVQNLINAGD